MGTIAARKRASGQLSYTAQIRLKEGGKVVHTEAKTFEQKTAAKAWMRRREAELAKPGGVDEARKPKGSLSQAIDMYIEDSNKAMGKTKAQVLRTIKGHDIAAMPCADIQTHHIIEWLKSIDATPATVGNYASHLAAVFAVARPMWNMPLDAAAMKDAITVARRMGITGRSIARERVPTLEELDKLLAYFTERRRRTPQAMPMSKVILFGLFSTRRQEEIVTIRWADYEKENGRVMVRDMKNPGEKQGNDVWCDLPAEAVAVIESMPRRDERIFPYSTDAVSANFTRACKVLGIDDLRFHDLRHAGASRLFEMGWQIPKVAMVTGHRSWVSLKRYTHIRHSGDRYENWEWSPLSR